MCSVRYAGIDCSYCSSGHWGPRCLRCPACVHGLCNSDTGRPITALVGFADIDKIQYMKKLCAKYVFSVYLILILKTEHQFNTLV